MKFNWGTGIALFYSFFVLVLVVTVIRSTQYDNSLVSDHYYADDLAYQKHYDKLVNSQGLAKNLTIAQNNTKTAVELEFPAEIGQVNGQIHFFCPSDSKLDFRLGVQPNGEHKQVISTQGLKPGMWRVKVDWTAEGKDYYKEEVIII